MTVWMFAFLLMPICATIAGLVVWAANREEWLADGELIRHFLFVLVVCVLIVVGIGKTDAVRLRIDPQFRLQTELEAHPVYVALKQAPDDHKELHRFLATQMSHGGTLAEAFMQARPLLTRLTQHTLGFADQKATLSWAQVTVDGLRELQARDTLLCYQALSSSSPDQQAAARVFSADNSKAFQRAVIEVYDAAHRDARQKHSSTDEAPVEFNAAALEYHVIGEAIAQKFGEPVSRQLSERAFPDLPIASPAQMCAARIAQLDAMLERPQAMASRLLQSVLR